MALAQRPTERTRAWPTTVALLGLLAALFVLPLARSQRADAYVYWTSLNSIGRSNLDGTGVDPSFITGAGTPSFGVAVDAEHIYWARYWENGSDTRTGSIARANLDGSGADPSFIDVGFSSRTVAVDASRVYWTNGTLNTIGRANLDGSGANPSFITTAGPPWGVAVDAEHVYWANVPPSGLASANQRIPPSSPPYQGTIGRANLDGSDVDQNFIPDAGFSPLGVAVDARHIYWVYSDTDTIARSNLDGTHVDRAFITVGTGAFAVAVNARHVYWTNNYVGPSGLYTSAIGRANLDGTEVNQSFITGANDSYSTGVAVNSLPDTKSPKTKITKDAPNTLDQGEVKFRFKSSEPNSAFECKLDKKTWKICTSPNRFKVRSGKHTFKVRATDAAGNTDPTPAKDKFKAVG